MTKKSATAPKDQLIDLLLDDEDTGTSSQEPLPTQIVSKKNPPQPEVTTTEQNRQTSSQQATEIVSRIDSKIRSRQDEENFDNSEENRDSRSKKRLGEPELSGQEIDIENPGKVLPQLSPPPRASDSFGARDDSGVYQSVHLAQTEHLRIAQKRILDLERANEIQRTELEQLTSAGETLKNRLEELQSRLESMDSELREKTDNHGREKEVLEGNLKSRAREVGQLRLKIEELEGRLNMDLKKIRVRERDLENRLELMKSEHGAVIRSKDEMILDLKRKIDQLSYEIENYRNKGKELNQAIEIDQERIRRTVKALRLALTMLEGEDTETKKAE